MAVDPISSALITAGTKEVVAESKGLIKNVARSAYDNLAVKFEKCFQGHVQFTFDKCSKIKNILYKDEAIDFKSRYVRGYFEIGKKTLSDSQLLSYSMNSRNIIVSGTAGTGKTMFMRWAALSLIDGMKNHGRVPLYLELRYSTAAATAMDFEEYLYNTTSAIRDKASYGQFKNGLKSGLFVILLDAVDEISPEFRPGIVSSIVRFSENYPACSVIMSSRPDEFLTTIQSFTVFKTKPMTMAQIKEVISKLEWNEETKSKLLIKLEDGIYKGIEDFLSNPLLATMLLLTYDDAAEIPNNLSSFYQQVFEVLYHRHDATKGAYKRKLYAGLSASDFQSLFSTFSFQTYLDYKVEFTDKELLDAFKEAADYEGIEEKACDLVKDSMESACLIQKEGLDNSFVHRSFQEFFCAYFISNYKEDNIFEIIEAVFAKEGQSNVLRMVCEISPETFEYEWLLPKLNDFLETIEKLNFFEVGDLSEMIDIFSGGLFVGVDSGEVEYTIWASVGNTPRKKIIEWMKAVDWITQNKSMTHKVVMDGKIWTNYYDFIKSIPENVSQNDSDIENRIEFSPFTKEDEDPLLAVRIEEDDAYWLVLSNLPALFEDFRSKTRERRDSIIAKRNAKKSKIKSLLKGGRGSKHSS